MRFPLCSCIARLRRRLRQYLRHHSTTNVLYWVTIILLIGTLAGCTSSTDRMKSGFHGLQAVKEFVYTHVHAAPFFCRLPTHEDKLP